MRTYGGPVDWHKNGVSLPNGEIMSAQEFQMNMMKQHTQKPTSITRKKPNSTATQNLVKASNAKNAGNGITVKRTKRDKYQELKSMYNDLLEKHKALAESKINLNEMSPLYKASDKILVNSKEERKTSHSSLSIHNNMANVVASSFNQ